ncbi:MAG: CoA transferase [Bryobacterales bacterium]|nr:CoA transferase [Bryobacterales bacterium]
MTGENVLTGLRVVDCATYIAGPSAAAVMADYGADVIKIERPPLGDPYRLLASAPGMPLAEWNYCWIMDSRSKRSVALDLNQEAARQALLRLIRRADVFVTNYQPALLRKFRLRYEDLRPENVRLIHASVTGYGETGEEADKPGYDMTAYFARSGLMQYIRNDGADPAVSPCGFGDHPTAMSLFGAVMMALYRRERTGEGAKVTANLMHNGVWSNGSMTQAALCGATFAPPQTRSRPHNPLVNHYATADGRRFLLCLLDPAKDWGKLCRALGRPEWIDDARFSTPGARRENAAELVAHMDTVTGAHTMEEWRGRFTECDVLYGVVPEAREHPEDGQMEAAGVFADIVDAPRPMKTVASPFHVEGVEKSPARWAPEVGQHTVEVLSEAGYGEEELRAMLETGAARQHEGGV